MSMNMIKFDRTNNSTFLALPSEMISDGQILAHFKRNPILCTAENANTKLSKSYKLHPEYRTAYVALLPANYSGHNVCPNHAHCKAHCIGFSAGRNRFDNSIMGKYLKTLYYSRMREKFVAQLCAELERFEKLCGRTGRIGAIRLNAFSDIAYEVRHPEVFSAAPRSVFYDYTKLLGRFSGQLPANYHLTYSLVSAVHDMPAIHKIATLDNIRCSAVFSRAAYEKLKWSFGGMIYSSGLGGINIVDGDDHDLTFLRPAGKVLILREKSKLGGINPLTYQTLQEFTRINPIKVVRVS